MIVLAALTFLAEVDANTGLIGGVGATGLGILGWMAKEMRAMKSGIKSEVKAEMENEKEGATMRIAGQPLEVRASLQYATANALAEHIEQDLQFHKNANLQLNDMRNLLQAREDRLHERVNKLTEKVGELVGQLKLITQQKGARS